MEIKGWKILYFSLFKQLLDELESEVEELKQKDPEKYKSHPKSKLLSSVYFSVTQDVPNNPNDRRFLLGKTLGQKYKNWRRVKGSMPPRYRLFFRFNSDSKEIIFAWFNDSGALRKAGSYTDVYQTFRRMLEQNIIPPEIKELKEQSQIPPA